MIITKYMKIITKIISVNNIYSFYTSKLLEIKNSAKHPEYIFINITTYVCVWNMANKEHL